MSGATDNQQAGTSNITSARGTHGTTHACALCITALRKESKPFIPLLLVLGGGTDPPSLQGHPEEGCLQTSAISVPLTHLSAMQPLSAMQQPQSNRMQRRSQLWWMLHCRDLEPVWCTELQYLSWGAQQP